MVAVVAASALLVAGLGLAACGSDEEGAGDTTETTTSQTVTATDTTTTTTTTETTPPPEKPTVVRIAVVNGAPKGGIVRRTVDKDDRVVLVVTSDVADEIHLHGYEISRDVAAGGTARLRFKSTVPGRFEVELENRGVQIADISVQP